MYEKLKSNMVNYYSSKSCVWKLILKKILNVVKLDSSNLKIYCLKGNLKYRLLSIKSMISQLEVGN